MHAWEAAVVTRLTESGLLDILGQSVASDLHATSQMLQQEACNFMFDSNATY